MRILDLAQSPPAWLVRGGRLAAGAAIPVMVLLAVLPLLLHPWTLGQHNWDQMNTQREVVVQTIRRFHQFPFWDPFTCGGHPAWGSLESDPIVVSPWLPVYLLAPLPIAIRVEIILSALVGALGAWKLCSRFTATPVVRVLFVVITVVNSRWAMQLAAGHSWHLLYGLLPWILYLLDRAMDPATIRRDRVRDVVAASGCLALMAYGCGIYPVPHTAFAVAVYALMLAKGRRSLLPVYVLCAFGVLAFGLAAPKLVPLFESLQRFPRIVKSDEAIFPQYIAAIFTRRESDYNAYADFVSGAMWHEWGLYLGWPAMVGLLAAIVASRGERERALKWAGWIMFSFVALAGPHPLTPWRLLHLLPLFKSQHVPARWLYATMIVLACCAASGADRWLERIGAKRRGAEALLGIAALALALDLGSLSGDALARSFVNPSPAEPAQVGAFHMEHKLAPRPDYRPGLWDVSSLPAVVENIGTLQCVTDNGLSSWQRDGEGRMPGVGAYGIDDPDYRGEAYVVEGTARATVASFTPNEVVVQVEGARPGDHLVLNQNWDPGWLASGAAAPEWHDAVSAVLTSGHESVVFRYRPRTLWLGLAIGVLALGSAAAALWASRRAAA